MTDPSINGEPLQLVILDAGPYLTEPYFPEHSAGDYRGQVGPRPCPTYAAEVRWERHWTIWARGRQDRHEAASL